MKKRFVSFLLFAAFVFVGIVAARPVEAASAVHVDHLMGQPISEVEKHFGKQTRTDTVEYSFKMRVYNKNYRNFALAGYIGGKTVAVYTNTPSLVLGDNIRVGSSRNAVREQYGKPLSAIRVGNKYYVLNHTNEKDTFLWNGYYITVFYDTHKGTTVASVMIVKQEYEERAMAKVNITSVVAKSIERQTKDIINAKRAVAGLKPLEFTPAGANFAASRSADMRKRQYFSHYTPEGLSPATQASRRGFTYKSMGENIGLGHRNAIILNERLMNSSGHRSNILKSSYTHLGVGAKTISNKYAYVTETFIRR
ncbi:MAG: CAP-associated domain-containing protein [Christensenellales bacterium]